jgi:GNAT superfamily N-acetyltransferase
VAIEVAPATRDRFDDVATMLGPKNPSSSVCWCLSHRVDSKTNQELVGPARGEYVRSLCGRDQGPGVLAYDDGEVVGWAAVAPRSELPFARSRKIPHVDDLPVWSVWCIRVRPGHRGKGISQHLLAGAVAYARSQGAPAVEGYPVDNQGEKVDHHGVRRHPQALRTSRLHQGRRHTVGVRRVPPRAHALDLLKLCDAP